MGSKNNKTKKKFYAVDSDRIDEPTIYDDWAVVQPLITGIKPRIYKGFSTLEKAKNHMKDNGVMSPRVITKEEDTTPPQPNDEPYYAVASGRYAGIHPDYYGGAEREVSKFSGNCHKRFRSESEAEASIEVWKNSVADLYRRAIKKHLDDGIRPMDMEIEKRAKNMLLMADSEKEDIDAILEKIESLKIPDDNKAVST